MLRSPHLELKGGGVLAFFVSLVPIALKALAGSFGSAVGQRLGNAFSSGFAASGQPQLVSRLASNPTPSEEMQAQRVIVSSMSADPQLRKSVEETLEQARPGTIAKAQETAQKLAGETQLVQQIANGDVHYSEWEKAMAKFANWTDEQTRYYVTDNCPIGGEDVPLFGVKYRDANGKEASMFSSALLSQAFPITARCAQGHEWRVDKPK